MSAHAFGSLHRAVDRFGQLPGLFQWRQARFDHAFETPRAWARLFRGVYDSYDAAERALPADRPHGYDHPDAALLYRSQLRAAPHDYAAFFWLKSAFDEGCTQVFDVGGNVGIKFYAFRRFAPLPPGTRWLVEDLPAVVAAGRRMAGELRAGPMLAFTDRFSDGSGAEALLAFGSLQYLPVTLVDLLGQLASAPRRVIVNTLPIHPSRSYFTVNHIGPSWCVYRVQAHDDFVRAMTAAGYLLRDEWSLPGLTLDLPFEDGYSLDRYTGFCFDRAA